MAYTLTDEKYCPYSDDKRCEFLCDTDADFADLPTCAPGSMAISAPTGNIQVVNASGEWVAFGG